MYELSNKQTSSIIHFILNSKDFLTVLILRNKYFFVSYYDRFGNPSHYFVWTIKFNNDKNLDGKITNYSQKIIPNRDLPRQANNLRIIDQTEVNF